jgi:hypothetical protein
MDNLEIDSKAEKFSKCNGFVDVEQACSKS